MEDIAARLKDTSEACIKSFEDWRQNLKDPKVREAMQESIHELRKVTARLEIEMAISEREQMGSKPLPIPSHRANGRRKAAQDNGNGGHNEQSAAAPDNAGNGDGGPRTKVERKPVRRGRKASGGNE